MLKGSRIRVQVSDPGGQPPPPPPPPAPEGYHHADAASSSSSEGGDGDGDDETPAACVVEALFGNRASVVCTSLPQAERARRVSRLVCAWIGSALAIGGMARNAHTLGTSHPKY